MDIPSVECLFLSNISYNFRITHQHLFLFGLGICLWKTILTVDPWKQYLLVSFEVSKKLCDQWHSPEPPVWGLDGNHWPGSEESAWQKWQQVGWISEIVGVVGFLNSYIIPSWPITTYITSKIWCSLDLLVEVLVSSLWFPLQFKVSVKLGIFQRAYFWQKGVFPCMIKIMYRRYGPLTKREEAQATGICIFRYAYILLHICMYLYIYIFT